MAEASDAKEGLETALNGTWDLILVDIMMPGRSGLDLIQDIRREKPAQRILVVSSLAERDYAMRALNAGAAGYVSKQSAADILITAVQRILAGRRYVSVTLAEQFAGTQAGDSHGNSHETLSNRELQVLRLIASGKSIKEISSELALSEKTVATYRSRITEKTGLTSLVEMTRYALQHGLVE